MILKGSNKTDDASIRTYEFIVLSYADMMDLNVWTKLVCITVSDVFIDHFNN